MKMILLQSVSILYMISPILIFLGCIIGIIRKYHWSKWLSLVGIILAVAAVVAGFMGNAGMESELGTGIQRQFFNTATIQMFLTVAGYSIFGLGFIISNLFEKR